MIINGEKSLFKKTLMPNACPCRPSTLNGGQRYLLIWKKSEVEGTGIRRDDWDDIYLQEFVDYQVSEGRIDELGHGQYQISDAQIDEK
jgi:hypothetical protein